MQRSISPSWRNALALAVCLIGATGFAQKKDDAPRITAIAPLEIAPGVATTVKIRGLKLDDAKDVRFLGFPEQKAELKEKKKVEVPNGTEAKTVGDTQAEVIVTLPADTPAGRMEIVLITGAGETEPREIIVADAASFLDEKEENNGFDQAQPIELGKTMRGQVKQDRDVDVFAFTLATGGTVVIEAVAARASSLHDPLLTVFDDQRRIITMADDGESRDPTITLKAPAPGRYFIVVQDANDRGGAWHNYHLTVKETP